MQPAKRAPWETKGASKGLSLDDPSQLRIVTGKPLDGFQQIGIECVHNESIGWSFANIATVQTLSSLETCSVFFLITKGYVKNKIVAFGVEESRVVETVVTVLDPVCGVCEPRAVTITNLATDPCDFVQASYDDDALRVEVKSMIAVLIELRKSDSSGEDWEKYRLSNTLDEYVLSLLTAFGIDKTSIQHRTVVKQDYVCKRLMIPYETRDRLYVKSGAFSVQVRPCRRPSDPAESGLELLRVDHAGCLSSLYKKFEHQEGFLGCFGSQGARYIRVKDEHIADMRRAIYPNSDRFSEKNISIKIVDQYKCLGFPTGTSLKVVASSLEGLGWIVIPLRVVHLNELAIVFVGSNEDPPDWRFVTSAGPIVIQKYTIEQRSQQRPKAAAHQQSGSVIKKLEMPMAQTLSDVSTASSQPSTSAANFDPWANWKPTGSQNQVLASRVERLEKQMSAVNGDIKDLQKHQVATTCKLETMQAENAQGFKSLMAAIQEIKMSQSAASTPIQSPPLKLPRQS
ncbi:unnamed protein product [Symbiodinium natans]|uniref:Uncharacterized protein n=1 Tax=Symbiodinium natans TaxID=878477 RepID=A0A812PYL0_9DINO|nr:unnamed protein product [Symbiodinium natans]